MTAVVGDQVFLKFLECSDVTEQGRGAGGWFMIYYYRKDPPFLTLEDPPSTHTY